MNRAVNIVLRILLTKADMNANIMTEHQLTSRSIRATMARGKETRIKEIVMEINGKPVINGKRKWQLLISEVDIAGSRRKGPGQCAAARAIMREQSGVISVRVHISRVFLEYEKFWERYATPGSLRGEVIAFDRGGTFMPGIHYIRPLSPANIRALEAGKPSAKVRKTGKAKIARVRQYNTYGVRERGATR